MSVGLETVRGRLASYKAEYEAALSAYKNNIQSNTNSSASEAAVRDVLRRWRGYTQEVSAASDLLQESQDDMAELARLSTEIEEQRTVLQRLRTEAGTRSNQADVLNPKERQSPYTNLLSLNRVFRPSTRNAIIAATVLFAILALAIIGIFIYRTFLSGLSSAYAVSTTGGIAPILGFGERK